MKRVETVQQGVLATLAAARPLVDSRFGGYVANEVAVVTSLVRVLVERGVAAQPVRSGMRSREERDGVVDEDVWCDPRA